MDNNYGNKRRKRRHQSRHHELQDDPAYTGRPVIGRAGARRILRAIGAQAQAAHADHDLQALADSLEDAMWVREATGLRHPGSITGY